MYVSQFFSPYCCLFSSETSRPLPSTHFPLHAPSVHVLPWHPMYFDGSPPPSFANISAVLGPAHTASPPSASLHGTEGPGAPASHTYITTSLPCLVCSA